MSAQRVIEIHPDAPRKPAEGAACNGCGVCCSAEPCPLGMLLSRRRRGACAALAWEPDQHRYVCDALVRPQRFVPLPWRWTQRAFARWARRLVAAGHGCDSSVEVLTR
ncbi:hypothetical protein [Azohydromonas aeria]|uniref:hypothetical protein n=1 Tax=Azohydromonas aeria TaxID=2590212 RepID=UPI0012FBB3CE|nr:hypothetical protein [Azohydromonas aeria]